MLLATYCALNYAGIIGQGLTTAQIKEIWHLRESLAMVQILSF